MGNCFKRQSANERLLQLDKNYSKESKGSGSLYKDPIIHDESIYDMEPIDVAGRNPRRGPRKPMNGRSHVFVA